MGLLDAAYFDGDNVTDLFVVTWNNYTYCGTHTITFQLAIASTPTATYALFLYDGEGECNPTPPVITGFKTEVGGAYHHPIIMGENVSDLWNTSNAQKDGLFIYEISTNTPTQSRCSNLIPASEHYGGIDRVNSSHDSVLVNHPLHAPYQYSNQNLITISIYHNGSVRFNKGSIAVFLTDLTGEAASYLLDSSDDDNIDSGYLISQKKAIISFLNSANTTDSNVIHFIVITWEKYEYYCQEKLYRVTFQLAIASTPSATYAVFLYCGKGQCNPDPPVITGCNTGDSCGYWQCVEEFENVWSLWESSNIGINGVFVYEISKLPSGIRLDKKVNNRTGLVEVCHEGEWRSVCDDYWTDVDADVACRQLGFLGYAAQARQRGWFNDNEAALYWLDNVKCRGSESSLFDCGHNEIENHNCHQRERAGVRCKTKGDLGICFAEGKTRTNGTILMRYNNEWRSVCNNLWSQEDARVACRELGFSSGMPMSGGNFNATESPKFWMDNVKCRGYEESLFACKHRGLGQIRRRCYGPGKRARALCV